MFTRHPWNSILHETVTSYFETVLSSRNASLYYDIIANAGLAHFVMKGLISSQTEKTGYIGYLVRIAIAIQHVFNMKGNLFFRLYCCNDEKCQQLFPHPMSRQIWNDFYCKFVANHFDLCVVDVFGIFVLFTIRICILIVTNKNRHKICLSFTVLRFC